MSPTRKKTTPPRARAKEAVAEEVAPAPEPEAVEEAPVEQTDETVADPTPAPAPVDDAVSLAPPTVPTSAPSSEHQLGPCVRCGAPGVVKADFPWTADKPVFCRKDCPPQYRFLLRA